MAKRGAPTLLEITNRYPPMEPIVRRPRREPRQAREPKPKLTRTDSVDRTFLSLPPTIRVPIGYVFITSAAIIAVVLSGYFIGFSRGSASERSQHAQQAARDLDQQSVRDPLLRTAQLNPQLLQAPNKNSSIIAATYQPNLAAQTPSLINVIIPIAPDIDPRQPGKNYYIIARDLPDEAVRAATYLRQQGIRACALPTGRPDRKLVVAIEPFASDMATSQEARDYKAKIFAAGRLWKRDHKGTTDFSDCYLARYSN